MMINNSDGKFERDARMSTAMSSKCVRDEGVGTRLSEGIYVPARKRLDGQFCDSDA